MRRGLIVLSLALAAGGALAFPLAAFAHALAQSSDPATGEVLQNTPQFVTITFSETPDLRLSSIRILDTSGREYDQGAAQAPPGNPKQLRVAMKPAGKGVYTVSWRTVSAVDGHLATGSFAFGVGVSAASLRTGPSTVSGSPGPTPLAVAGRWFLYAGVALMLGAALVSLLAFSRLPPRSPQLLALGVMLAVLGTLAISESQRSDAAIAYGQILDTSLGRNLLARAAPMVAALVGLFLAWRGGTARRRWGITIVAVAAAGALLADVSASHATAASFPLFNGAVQWIHGLAATLWIGGLLALIVFIRGVESDAKARAVRRFSTAAGVTLVTVVVTGLIRAVVEIGAWDRLFSTSFGLLVLLKAGLLLVLAALGAVNRYRNVPWAARRLQGLRRVGSAEVVAGTAALLTAAGLVNVSPPAYASVQPPARQVVVTGSDFATTVRLRLVVSPGTAGFNYFTLLITDYDSRSFVTADNVTLRFSLPSRSDIGESSLTLKRARDGTYQGTGTNLSLEGRWRVDAFILRGARSVQVTLNVSPIAQPQRIDVVRAPGQPTLYTIHLSQGRTLQVYLDPGKAGANEFHSTFFDASGNELPVNEATISMRPPGGKRAPLLVRELEPGHFVADATVAKGKSGFDIVGTTADGEVLAAHIDIALGQ